MAKKGQCQVCAHPERERIEYLRASGVSIADLAEKFGLQRNAIWRHWHQHVSSELKGRLLMGPAQLEELRLNAIKESGSVLDHLCILRSALMAQLTVTGESNSPMALSRVADTLLRVLTEIGKINGEVSRLAPIVNINNTTNILNSQPMVELQGAILTALAPFPEARRAVVAALRGLEGPPVPESRRPPVLIEGDCRNA